MNKKISSYLKYLHEQNEDDITRFAHGFFQCPKKRLMFLLHARTHLCAGDQICQKRIDRYIDDMSGNYDPSGGWLLKPLKEIFVQSTEVENMPAGPRRDMAILRLSIIAELDAASLYEKLSLLTDNEDLKKVLLDVSNEEKVHVGEFQYLLDRIDEEYQAKEEEGQEEAKEIIEG